MNDPEDEPVDPSDDPECEIENAYYDLLRADEEAAAVGAPDPMDIWRKD